MKRLLLWSFERGSTQYDVICAVILAFIFLVPASFFDDRPDFMRVPTEDVQRTKDDHGNTVYTVKVNATAFMASSASEQAAVARLHEVVHTNFEISRTVPVYDRIGELVAYSIWVDGVDPY